MQTVYTFKSMAFQPTPSELEESSDEYINPGCFGRELADFMKEELQSLGYAVEFRCSEDWGYWQEFKHSGSYTLAIGCSNIDESDGGMVEHCIFVMPDKPTIRPLKNWFRKTPVRSEVQALVNALGGILQSNKQIIDIKLT